jgi:phosphoribosylaminoimidazole carboxylase PurE protein
MSQPPVVGIIMGSDSDLKVMSEAAKILEELEVSHEVRIISAHRTPEIMTKYAQEALNRGLKVIIAGAGGSAHLPGMTASETVLPVLAVPVKSDNSDHEALWSNVKMPPGIPLATMPENGAKNAALLAIEILALSDSKLLERYIGYRKLMHDDVLSKDSAVVRNGWKKYLGR